MGIAAIVGGVGAAAGVGSALINSGSASAAANAQVQAANTASQTQLQMYNQTRQDLMPWMTTGGSALSQLAALYGLSGSGGAAQTPYGTTTGAGYGQPYGLTGFGINSPLALAGTTTGAGATPATGIPNTQAMTTALENTPGYQFTLSQGTQALDRSAAARGLDLSGGQLKDLTQYGQNLGDTNAWAPYVAQLNSLSTAGQNSAANVGTIGSSAASGIASTQLAAGNATAAGINNSASALTTGLSALPGSIQAAYGSSYGGSGGVSQSDLSALYAYNNPALTAASGVPPTTIFGP